MATRSPDNLAARIASGDTAAFDTVFRDLYAPLHLLAKTITSGDDVAAKDIVSEVFLGLWEKRLNLPDIQNLRAYLYTTTRNTGLNWLRQRAATARREHSYAYTEPELDDNAFLQTLYQAETMRALRAAINELPTECQRVVELGLEGLGTGQIAEQLGISASAVSHQKARAVRLLKEKLPLSILILLGLITH